MKSELLKTKKLQSLKKTGQTIWTRFSSFAREHIIWIRIIAFLKFLLVYEAVSYLMWGFPDGNDGIFVIITIIILSSAYSFFLSIGLWCVTTKLMRYKFLVLLLYIPGIYYIGPTLGSVLYSDTNKEIMYIIEIVLQSIFIIFELFILICFWNKPKYQE